MLPFLDVSIECLRLGTNVSRVWSIPAAALSSYMRILAIQAERLTASQTFGCEYNIKASWLRQPESALSAESLATFPTQ